MNVTVRFALSKLAAEGISFQHGFVNNAIPRGSFLRLAALTPLAAVVTFPTLAPTWKTIPLIEP